MQVDKFIVKIYAFLLQCKGSHTSPIAQFLAALAALGLPWSFTHSLCWIQSLPAFQTKPKPCKIYWGHKKTWPDQQKDNDEDKYKDKYKDNDKDNDKYI